MEEIANKNTNRSTNSAQNKKIEDFKSTLDDLFDIAHQNVLQSNLR